MHHALEIPEILFNILLLLSAGRNYSERVLPQKKTAPDLAALVRTCCERTSAGYTLEGVVRLVP